VVRTDIDNVEDTFVEDTFDPGEIGNFELGDWVGELVPPLVLALALLAGLILLTGLAIRGPPLMLACLAGDIDEALWSVIFLLILLHSASLVLFKEVMETVLLLFVV